MRPPGERWVIAIIGVALAAAVGVGWYWFSYRPSHGAPDEVEVACVLGQGPGRVLVLREGVRRGLGLGTVHRIDVIDASGGTRRGRFQLASEAAVVGCADDSFWLRPGASGLEVRGLDGQRLADPAPGARPPPAPFRYTAPSTGHVEGAGAGYDLQGDPVGRITRRDGVALTIDAPYQAGLMGARVPRVDGDGAQPLLAPPDVLVSHAESAERGSPRLLTRFRLSPDAAHVVWTHPLGLERPRVVASLGDRLIVVLSGLRNRRDFRLLALDAATGAELWSFAP